MNVLLDSQNDQDGWIGGKQSPGGAKEVLTNEGDDSKLVRSK
jgi:hypothetical protein